VSSPKAWRVSRAHLVHPPERSPAARSKMARCLPKLVDTRSYTLAASVQDWRRRAAAPVEDRSRRTSREPAAGVMDRRRSGQSLDSGSWSLHTAELGQPAGPRHSPAPTGVRRGTSDGHGWIGSKAVEITGGRVGRAAIQDVPLREF
jgi:hypothetical protein